jgi:hypothetical protein
MSLSTLNEGQRWERVREAVERVSRGCGGQSGKTLQVVMHELRRGIQRRDVMVYIILWLLGVPLILIILLWLVGIGR